MASYQYIYVMQNLSKVFPGGKELFKNISLSFFPVQKSVFWALTGPVSRHC